MSYLNVIIKGYSLSSYYYSVSIFIYKVTKYSQKYKLDFKKKGEGHTIERGRQMIGRREIEEIKELERCRGEHSSRRFKFF